ncbi:unnamed protein product [Adineta steineri]|uniref:G-protein coupled receptors family 1 profile domain-containing protein n=1 Tax=Adineta steineri TaxID=433720 RepID=A0A818VQE9_9BILA|nr:unnamed protein product [Adineta steineri]CAF3714419.1 unnamed protein product [Adineta steineri]
MISEQTSTENFSNNNLNSKPFDDKFDLQLFNYNRYSSSFAEITLINNNFQVITSIILCILGLFTAILYIGILFQRYFQTKSCSRHTIIRFLFDCCHLINILLTHIIIVIVYIAQTTNFHLHCPLSTFLFSLASFGSISFLCLGAFNRYKCLFKKQSQYRYIRHRLLAHRIILITSLSWLIINFPKLDLHENF